MKVYISCDLDGVCGVVDRDQLFDAASADYRHACRLLTAEVNAAVAGALSVGATEVVVNDGHYRMRNLIPDELHPRAQLIAGRFKPGFMVEGLDSSFGVVLFIGYHAQPHIPCLRFAPERPGVQRRHDQRSRSRVSRRAGGFGYWRHRY